FYVENITDYIESLTQKYETSGFQLVKVAGTYQFRSNPAQSDILQKLLEDKPVRISASALEVLSIISYKQPVSRAEIDAVRGVDSGHLTRGLMEKNLIKVTGHAETPGRPLLYGTTPYFLEVFTLDSLDNLPSLEEFNRELSVKGHGSEESEDADIAQADSIDLDEAAEFFDRESPLAANPDRGMFDEPDEEEVDSPDFGLEERAREESL
ncbi:SMC-Scp complex subunit ScpB, partial [bacterium]|nr:SMC-Scp complex subunit ScpB [bacterium]